MAGLLLAALVALAPRARAEAPEAVAPPQMVAHAGGGLAGKSYLNSLEALEANYARGFRAFELDFHWTGDEELVLVHDWGREFVTHFGLYEPPLWEEILSGITGKVVRPPLEVFLAMGRERGFTPLTAQALAEWMEKRTDALAITDVKAENLRALTLLAERYPALRSRIVPQIYRFDEWEPVRDLGYPRIILATYALIATVDETVAFAGKARPWAVTLPLKKALATDLPMRLESLGLFVYAHTVNDPSRLGELIERGVRGFYTDFLPPRLSEALKLAPAGPVERRGPPGVPDTDD